MRQVIAQVISNSQITADYYLMWLDSPDIANEARPGQFVMVRCGRDTLLRRPFSIHQRDGHNIALLFTAVGKGTDWLSRRQSGDNIDILGPLGNGFTIRHTAKNLLLVAGGMGIAPMVFLAQEASQKNYEVVTLAGAHTAGQIDLEGHLPGGIRLICVAEDGSLLKKGLVTEFVPDYFGWADQIFACGPVPMYHHIAEDILPLKKQLGNKSIQVSLEMRMGCGLGACYACTVKTKSGLKQVCRDGPVFDLNEVIWDELSPKL